MFQERKLRTWNKCILLKTMTESCFMQILDKFHIYPQTLIWQWEHTSIYFNKRLLKKRKFFFVTFYLVKKGRRLSNKNLPI